MQKYEEDCKRIFEESYANYILMVLPMEWKSSEEIKNHIKAHRFKVEVIGAVGYIKDNQRAKANLVLFYRSCFYTEVGWEKKLSQDYNLGGLFQDLGDFYYTLIHELENEKRAEIANDTQGMDQKSFFEYLLKRYEKDRQDFFENFRHIGNLSAYFLSRMKITKSELIINAREFEARAKKFYWDECLSRIPVFTSVLTQSQQAKLLDEFAEREEWILVGRILLVS